MRTTLDLPDALLRQLKAKAALEGTTLKAMLQALVERGLSVPATAGPVKRQRTSALPSIKLGHALNLPNPSNATLFELLDE